MARILTQILAIWSVLIQNLDSRDLQDGTVRWEQPPLPFFDQPLPGDGMKGVIALPLA